MTDTSTGEQPSQHDARVRAFLSRSESGLFHPIAHSQDVWNRDPWDVESIHVEARTLFEREVEVISQGKGRLLLLRGQAGSGKTHLMRAFRNYVHAEGRAFFGYMQMTSSAERYDRYILRNLIESLEKPYSPPETTSTSLTMLSGALCELLPRREVERLQGELKPETQRRLANELADRLVDRLAATGVDLDTLRALLFLQIDRPSVRNRVLKFLRMEALSEYDREILGGIAPRDADHPPIKAIGQLATLVHKLLHRGLVICLDQLEDMLDLDDVDRTYARAMSTVKTIAEQPHTLVVVACLDEFYAELRTRLPGSLLDRIEHEPAPVVLRADRNAGEVDELVGRRLAYLYEQEGVAFEKANPTYPFPPELVAKQKGQTTRRVLQTCSDYRRRACEWGQLVDAQQPIAPSFDTQPPPPDLMPLRQAWNDFVQEPQEVPDEEGELATLLAEALESVPTELNVPGALVVAPSARPHMRSVRVSDADGDGQGLLVAVCEKSAKGGGLGRQVDEALGVAKGTTLALVRSTEFFKSKRSKIAKQVGTIVASGGRRVVVENADWRRMVAFRLFRREHGDDPCFLRFLRTERPMTMLPALRTIAGEEIELAQRDAARARTQTAPSRGEEQADYGNRARPQAPPAEATPDPARILLGATRGRRAETVGLAVQDLKRHATFMGKTGSGKTTAALSVIEQLLERGISALLVDRKGDLCGYADPGAWDQSVGDAKLDARRGRLRETVDVAVLTPGDPSGRSLALPALPAGAGSLPEHELDRIARVSANSLAELMKFGGGKKGQGMRAALQKALVTLADDPAGTGPISYRELADYMQERDMALLGELGPLEKYLDEVGEYLEFLLTTRGALLGHKCEPLDAAYLFGTDLPKENARLSVICTKGLGSDQDVQFWVAQLLVEISRWLDAHPSKDLQAVVMLDEADIYLPANGKPPTKGPLEHLLKRARSAGLGLLLATQSPGDLDYKCRDNILSWLVGTLGQDTALSKLKDMFGSTDPSAAARQTQGEFLLVTDGKVTPLRAKRNAVQLPGQLAVAEIARLAAASGSSR